jgi:hypothetical protein
MNLPQPELTWLLNLAVDKAHSEAFLDPQIGQCGPPSPLGRMLRGGVHSLRDPYLTGPTSKNQHQRTRL